MTLTLLEIFTTLLSIVSIVFNVIQWRDHKASRDPLSNSLIALFNDIKSKQNHAFLTQNMLFSVANPHADIRTMRWEQAQYLQSAITSFQGLQEQVVALLVTLRPDDKEGSLAFKAMDYGLTDADKTLRERNLKLLKSTPESGNQDTQIVPPAPASPTAEKNNDGDVNDL